jgi:bacteriocin-type transport-associated protein
MVNAGQRKEIATGTVLIQEGQPVPTLYIVLAGTLSLSVAGTFGENQEVAKVSGGEIVGEMSLLDVRPSSVTALALEPSQVLAISQKQLAAKLQQDMGFASRFYRAIAVLLSNRLRGISALLARSKVVPGQSLRKVLLVFSELIDSDIDWTIATGTGSRVAPGTILIQQGQPADALYILLEGTLAVSVSIPQGGSTVSKEIARLLSGEIVGEMSFIDSQPPSATVKAPETSFVLSLPRSGLTAKLQQDLGFASRFYRAIAVVLLDRLRDRLVQRGYGNQAYDEAQPLNEDMEYEDEIDMDVLENVSLAGARFDWLLRRVQSN